MAVTKTRTGLELNWRWTRTFMFFNGFSLFITFLTTRGGLTRYIYFTLIAHLTFQCLSESSNLFKIAALQTGNALLHHPKLLVFFHWLNLLQSVYIHLSRTGSHDLLNYI